VENSPFSIDFGLPQAALLRTTGYPDPHEYRGFVHKGSAGRTPQMRFAKRERSTGNNGDPTGAPRRRKIEWQLE